MTSDLLFKNHLSTLYSFLSEVQTKTHHVTKRCKKGIIVTMTLFHRCHFGFAEKDVVYLSRLFPSRTADYK